MDSHTIQAYKPLLFFQSTHLTGEPYKGDSHVDLDFDHQFIPSHKFDAKYSYKQDHGYFPGWASIGGIIVGGENRDGNTNVKFPIKKTRFAELWTV